jgi:dTMP kinase
MKTGKFFVIDGGDGSGKSTQIKRLKAHLGDRALITREPGGCPRAEIIREEIFAHREWPERKQFEEFWRARTYHFEDTIIPALIAGRIIISDRLDSSTWSYQIAQNNHPELIPLFWELRRKVMGGFEPDLYIYFDIDVEIGLARKAIQKNELNHFDLVSVENHRRRQLGYKEFLSYVPHRIIDASRPEDKVFDEIISILES